MTQGLPSSFIFSSNDGLLLATRTVLEDFPNSEQRPIIIDMAG